ncbi:phage tail family protein [Bacillus sp. FJAT-49705]|uniref:Phage tail family protein n=1 Tax=Cytobacillus citreus TaxID=2833586 RepID=A0ABS5NV89_9BACI|nr:phage tail family protein [Cytobacillus citreus]MBS4191740.1 phage tail family protein [Cytobacillus citreus]
MIDEKFIFISARGDIVELANDAPFILLNHEGVGAVKSNVQMQKSPFQDGQTHTDSVLEIRPINLELLLQAKSQDELFRLRAKLTSVFNPKLGAGTLKYVYGSLDREIKATSEFAPIFPPGESNRGSTFQVALMSLICSDPFWLDPHTESEPMSAWIGGMEFPFQLPVEFAMKSSSTTLLNDGDVEVPVEIVFHGPAVNPIVTNKTTGEFIRVKRTLGANDKLIVRTAFGNKTVLIIDGTGKQTRAFNWLDENSIFWQLDVGYNEIEYNMDSNSDDANVVINWRKRYVGV